MSTLEMEGRIVIIRPVAEVIAYMDNIENAYK
jgi:hypothetical protein